MKKKFWKWVKGLFLCWTGTLIFSLGIVAFIALLEPGTYEILSVGTLLTSGVWAGWFVNKGYKTIMTITEIVK